MLIQAVAALLAVLMCPTPSAVAQTGSPGDAAAPGAAAPPEVTLESPESGAVLSGMETVTAAVQAEETVTAVVFAVDGVAVETVTARPYAAAIDTTLLDDGPHVLQASAFDVAGGIGASETVGVLVDQAAGGAGRLEQDRAAGVVTAEQFAEHGLNQVFAPDLVPDRYRLPQAPTDATAAVLSTLRDFESLPAQAQERLRSALSPREEPSGPAEQGQAGGEDGAFSLFAAPAPAPACSTTQVFVFPGEVALPCQHHTEHATFFYQLDTASPTHGLPFEDLLDDRLLDVGQGGGGNGVTDYVDLAAASLEAAYDTYVRLGYREPGERLDVTGRLDVAIGDFPGGFASPITGLMLLSRDLSPVYLPRHELFHHFQYAYAGPAALASDHVDGPATTTGWWLEASAEWAAHQAGLGAPAGLLQTEDPVLYAQRLPDFLGAPTDALTTFRSPFGSGGRLPQYGAFVFAEYLEERFGAAVMRRTWEAVDGFPVNRRAVDALAAVLDDDHGAALDDVVADFHEANYALGSGYRDPDTSFWLGFLEAYPSGETRGDRLGGARPDRRGVTARLGRPVSGAFDAIGPGGVGYVDLVPEAGVRRNRLTVSVDASPRDAELIEARIVTWSAHPSRCRVQSYPVALREGHGTLGVDLAWNGTTCEFATLIVSNTAAAGHRSVAAGYQVSLGDVDLADWTVAIDPGAVSTMAGSGRPESVDGVGEAASLYGSSGGVVVLDGFAYVATSGSIRKVNLATREVTMLPGGNRSPLGCAAEAGRGLVTDGHHLYYIYTCSRPELTEVRRVSVATGAVSTVALVPYARDLAVGPGGHLFVVVDAGVEAGTVQRLDPASGVFVRFAVLGGVPTAVTADAGGLWAATRSPAGIVRVTFINAAVSTFATIADTVDLESAGDYLYSTDGQRVRRWSKADPAAWRYVAGTTTSGHRDGVGTDAGFTSISALASDGTGVLAADGNRLRRIVPAAALTAAQPPVANQTVAVDPGAVSTVAGSGRPESVDGVGEAASLHGTSGGVVVLDGFAYVATSGSIRRVNLATREVTMLPGGNRSPLGCAAEAGRGLVTDGHHLYYIYTCSRPELTEVRRVSVATGTVSTVAAVPYARDLAVGPDGDLFVVVDAGGEAGTVQRLDPVNGIFARFAVLGGAPTAVTADAGGLWVATSNAGIKRVTFAGAAVSTFATIADTRDLESAGDFLYSTDGSRVRRWSKADPAAWRYVAGTTTSGHRDGVGTDGGFSSISALASDGSGLLAADGNRLRRIQPAAALPAAQPPVANQTVAIDPGAVSTVAGSGRQESVDGVGEAASFFGATGAVAIHGFAYVGTSGSIRKVDLATREVTMLPGGVRSPVGCGTDLGTGLVTDGRYLFNIYTCNRREFTEVRRVSIATGAVSTVATVPYARDLAVGPGGVLFVAVDAGVEAGTVQRLDPVNGTFVRFAVLGGVPTAVTADAGALWVATSSAGIKRVAFAGAAVSTFAASADTRDVESAGDYLYSTDGWRVRRWSKADPAAWRYVAGITTSGHRDGVGTDAGFSSIYALASDGTGLLAADGNRLRRIVPAAALPAAQPPVANQTVAIDPGAVSTVAGSGRAESVDGVGEAASLYGTAGGAVVLDGFAYVGTAGSIRKVNLATREVTMLPGGIRSPSGCASASGMGLVTDGHHLYYLYECGYRDRSVVRRVSIATGAVSTVATVPYARDLAVGPRGDLFVAVDAGVEASTVQRLDPVNGTFVRFAVLGGVPTAVTADAGGLWVATSSAGIKRVAFAGAAVSTFAASADTRDVESAGDYLYSTDGWRVRRWSKADPAVWRYVAGTNASGHRDGVGTDAGFTSIYALASDGTGLLAADGNRLRRIQPA